MSAMGIRGRIKKGIKKVLGIGPGADTAPPNWQSRPAAASPGAARPVEVVPPPADRAEAASDAPDLVEDAAGRLAPASSTAASSPAPVAAAAEPLDDSVGPPLTPEAVQEILDEMVRPALQGDGGDITLVKVEDNNIYVKLVGACSTCPSSIMTMKLGVEALLKEEFPSMKELIDISSLPA